MQNDCRVAMNNMDKTLNCQGNNLTRQDNMLAQKEK